MNANCSHQRKADWMHKRLGRLVGGHCFSRGPPISMVTACPHLCWCCWLLLWSITEQGPGVVRVLNGKQQKVSFASISRDTFTIKDIVEFMKSPRMPENQALEVGQERGRLLSWNYAPELVQGHTWHCQQSSDWMWPPLLPPSVPRWLPEATASLGVSIG